MKTKTLNVTKPEIRKEGPKLRVRFHEDDPSMDSANGSIDFEPVEALSKDLRLAARTMGPAEVEYLVREYYAMQNQRIRAGHRMRKLEEKAEPSRVFTWLSEQSEKMEKQIRRGLQAYAEGSYVGRWELSNVGIGPVLAAACLSYIDIEKAPNVGHVYSYGGILPNQKWNKGEKRPWDAGFKNILWKVGESFKKTSGHELSYYGKYYAFRRKKIEAANEAGEYADQARLALETRSFDKDSPTYKSYVDGKLPVGRVGLRAMRYAVKLYLSHLHEIMFFERYGRLPGAPYTIAHMGHKEYFAPPNMNEVGAEFEGLVMKERPVVAPFWL